MSARLQNERWLSQAVTSQDLVLCFGNLPPIFRSKGRVAVFLQNRYLIERHSTKEFGPLARLRIALERLWFRMLIWRADAVFVQTESMKRALVGGGNPTAFAVHVTPYAPSDVLRLQAQPLGAKSTIDDKKFLYVASGEPHKNHRRLIEAWCLLAGDRMFPTLNLTLDPRKSPDLCAWISDREASHGLRITNLGALGRVELLTAFRNCSALIYPSYNESFGLPLIEARSFGIPIIAAELDYVRDVAVPAQTFDPRSPLSMSRAVKRFLGTCAEPRQPQSAQQFIEAVWEKTGKPCGC